MPNAQAPRKPSMPLHIKVLLGFMLGTIVGLVAHATAADAAWVKTTIDYVTQPFGQIFLNLLFMLVVPLMFSALVLGVAELGDIASLGRLGWKTLNYTAVVTALAVGIGLLCVNLLQPGTHMDPALVEQAMSNAKTGEIISKGNELRLMDLLVNIVPHNIVNAMGDDSKKLGIVFFALMIGIGLVMKPTAGTTAFKNAVQGLFEVCMHLIGMFIKLAPFAVAAFMFNLTARLGWDVIQSLMWFVVTVLLALAIHGFVVLPLWVRLLGGMPVRTFFRGTQEATLTAFATASSSATLPVTLRVAEENLKLPRKVSRFVLTVGASANHHGTALFEGITVLFLAQVYGLHLGMPQQLMVLLLCILGGIGTAGIPSGSLPVIAMICGIIGIKPEGIGIILGVNTFLDMCRTSLNVTGDLATAVVVSHRSGVTDDEVPEVPDNAGHH
ncbi:MULTISPECIES: dicarboxylate/amino acid:cation symporter [Stenotrophomonas]|uniref:Sodium:dicarboxylate symporter n=2 Tax=Stenotrophomonas nitritireducens TaxID=83617 RepID=A0ABR5NM18_9GAMM|nr:MULTISPECIES: dicarboxylate/amino acid:cation symporter [Stenotrophomonas]KQN96540.1 sodium:dicarboxylate symporter [Stenotrophomonas sp. Leaf70]KRG58796.1 sodium:dicarboxylate symporter [Stenotrophomonas nitritireducens]MBN8792500.1 dicarboxylate/amino acid:cation symporter [Stenotrophomonas nitritireducens]MBN8797024.1 dicarboxylate/amino acid:cation symporter [Stenotrophomonas nitritireducens]